MPKYMVHLAKEVTTMYYIEVEAKDSGEAQDIAWKDYLAGYSRILDNGDEVSEDDYIVVDEISMVKEVFYRFFTIIRRYAPKVKFIIVGDFEQFKPVEDTYEGTYEYSPARLRGNSTAYYPA